MTLPPGTMTRSAVRARDATAAPSFFSDGDAELVERFLRTDDEEAFEVLVRRYQDKVFRLAASIMGPGAYREAEDAAQEVFVVVLRRLKTFRREAAFSTWLYRVARNRIIDCRRRAAQRPSEVGDEGLPVVPRCDVLADPEEMASAAQRRARLLRHVARLNEPQRVVIHLHYWQGQSVAEISELLGLPPGTVKSHLHRARERLAVLLREGGCDE